MTAILEGADYDPLLATWPETTIDEELLRHPSLDVRVALTMAYAEFKEGFTESNEPWDVLLTLLRARGTEDHDVRDLLLGLTFLRHEARHHLDIYGTPLGWQIPSSIYGEYARAAGLAAARSPEEAESALAKLRRVQRVRATLFGNVPSFRAEDWRGEVLFEKQRPWGTCRLRKHTADDKLAIATIALSDSVERALSVNSILEARAVTETASHTVGRLRALRAADNEIISTIRILLDATIVLSRDDYWAALSMGLGAADVETIVDRLARPGIPRTRLMVASWFALHADRPEIDVHINCNPSLRYFVAVNAISKVTDAEFGKPRIAWNTLFEQLTKLAGGVSLTKTLADHQSSLSALRDEIESGTAVIRGISRVHVDYLREVAVRGMALRGGNAVWVDHVGWPKDEDPRTVVDWAVPPPAIRTAWSRLSRVRSMVNASLPGETIAEVARSLFAND